MPHALGSWLSGLPTPIAVAIGLLGGAGVSVILLLLAHRLLPHQLRRSHNDVSGFILAIVGTIYAVLLAFIAVAVWQNFGQADNLVQSEANLVGDLYRDTVALPDTVAAKLRHYLYVYAETVVQDEWPELAGGNADPAPGWQLLDSFHSEIVQFRAQDVGTAALQTEMVHTLNLLYDARRGRFHAATADLPDILWWTLLLGALVLMVFTDLFGVPQLLMHAAMVSLLGGLIGLVLALIVLLSNPFRGQNHVSVEPFNTLVRSVEAMDYPRN
jgi:hypothetical protein